MERDELAAENRPMEPGPTINTHDTEMDSINHDIDHYLDLAPDQKVPSDRPYLPTTADRSPPAHVAGTQPGAIAAPHDIPSIFAILQQQVSDIDLATTALPEATIIGDRLISTVAELLQVLSQQYQQLSEDKFLPVFLQGADLISELSHEHMQPWMRLMMAYERFGEALPAFQQYKTTEAYTEQFAPYKRVRDYTMINRQQVDLANDQVPAAYPRCGRALLAEYKGISWARQLKTLARRYPSEDRGISALNRAILDRVDAMAASVHGRKGRQATLRVTTADLDKALRLPDTFVSPTPAEIAARSLYLDRTLGTITSIPPAEQSYAATEPASSPVSTPQPSRFRAINSPTEPFPLPHRLPVGSSDLGTLPDLLADHAASTAELSGSQAPSADADKPADSAHSCQNTHTFPRLQAGSAVATGTMESIIPQSNLLPADIEALCPATPNTPLEPMDIDLFPAATPAASSEAEPEMDDEILHLAGEEVSLTNTKPDVPCVCMTNEILGPKEAATLNQIAQRPLHTLSVSRRPTVIHFLKAQQSQLGRAVQDGGLMCQHHAALFRVALGLRPTSKELTLERLAALACHSDSLADFEAFTQRDAERSCWFSRPTF
ncbi:hypothetical protein BDV12DRAFT_205160 [Aspergillus spectabilis]